MLMTRDSPADASRRDRCRRRAGPGRVACLSRATVPPLAVAVTVTVTVRDGATVTLRQ